MGVKIWCIMEDSISSSCLAGGDPKGLQDELISLTNTLLPELGEGFLFLSLQVKEVEICGWEFCVLGRLVVWIVEIINALR